MNHVVSIRTYLTDLGPYAVFSRIRGEFFARDPPTSTAVQVAGLLLNARIEIDAVAFLPRWTRRVKAIRADYRARTVRRHAGMDYDRAFAHVAAFGRAPPSCIQVPDAATGTGSPPK
jgi:hypothetical protein